MTALSALACRCLAVAALAGLAAMRPSPAAAEELVKFAAAAPRLHPIAERSARDGDKTAERGRGAPLQGYLTKPSGPGPFPAVVLLHSCLGLPANRQSIADALARQGYVALFVDDFAARGLKETCAVDFAEALPDAYGALAFLFRRPFVDGRRIGVVGYSQGADTALKIASSRFAVAFALPDGARFKVAAAFYPPCDNLDKARLNIPTLILVGEADDVTPAADCRRLAEAQPAGGGDVRLVVYPGAAHGFDNPEFAEGLRIYGMSLRYDRDVAERAKAALSDFLATKLAR
ncbi:MAG: dienelactone hydrolase family protein [Roseiarcus sp.]|jgi:dienelactone hydrolase